MRKWRAYRDDTHISLHSKKEMEKVLEDFGFEIIVSGTGGLLVGSLLRQGLDSFIWAANDNGDSYNILARLKVKMSNDIQSCEINIRYYA